MPEQRYRIEFTPRPDERSPNDCRKLSPPAVLAFCEGALAENPRRVDAPLFGPLAGCHGARRATRVVPRKPR